MSKNKNNINTLIKNNNLLVDEINQYLHNEGIEFSNRLNIIINILNYKFMGITLNINENLKKKIIDIIDNVSINKSEIYQKIFMFYADKKTKINLDQYYTPITIGTFINSLCISEKTHIDPACGTGDLIINYKGQVTLWDISNEIIEICELNCILHNKTYITKCINSIENYNKDNEKYDYASVNPPFGSNTVIQDEKILENYVLGKNKKKQEIGILFIERTINLVKNNGIIFIILPNGYLGNSNNNMTELRKYLLSFRILSILELPNNSFSRSGTGVSTSLLILQKTKTTESYDIFIKKIENIGYILNKKNTPFKYKIDKGNYILKDNKLILDNDFYTCMDKFSDFIIKNKITNINISDNFNNKKIYDYDIVSTKHLDTKYILDIKRYLSYYKNTLTYCIKNNFKTLENYLTKTKISPFKKEEDKEYLYLDIKQVNSPIYNKTNVMWGNELPSRAKISLKKNDLIVSKLLGKIVFTYITEDTDNIVCSNGFCLLRPNNLKSALIIFANLFTDIFKIQHNSLCTGSIMEGIDENLLKKIYINENIDTNKYTNILKSLEIINNEL